MTQPGEIASSLPSALNIPLPAAVPKAAADKGSLGFRRIALMGLLAALAFLLASFPARNSDLWMHLASGRLLAQGRFSPLPDAEPSTESASNGTWLYDFVSYSLYSILGGSALVFVKALLVAGLALVLLDRSRAGEGWCIPFLCTALALLAMSMRLPLQPATVSCLFLALVLCSIHPRTGEAASRSPAFLPPWPLLALFVVWANLDSGFLLGLTLVALFWLGELLDDFLAVGSLPGKWRGNLLRRASAFAALAAVCLINPDHIRAFILAPERGGFGFGGASPMGHGASPFQAAYFARIGLTPAGLAYFLLLFLSALSFALNLPRWHGRRLLPWLGLALLSVFQLRAIPFFAVVAGPVLAWNLQEAFARRLDRQSLQTPPWQRGFALGRVLTVAAGLILLVCAWPGWLQSPPFEPRRWAVELPPSVQRGAETIQRWHQEGKLGPDARGLHLTADTLHAFAWLCPQEKGLLLDRLTATASGSPGSSSAWQRRMHSAGITHVILHDADRQRLFDAMRGLLADPEQWPLLYQEGDLAVFGWRDPARAEGADPYRGWQLDLDLLAFHPNRDKWAPQTMPDHEPEARHWWEAFWKPWPPRSIDGEDAMLHLFHAEALRQSAPFRHQTTWEGSQLAGLFGAAAGWTEPANLLDARVRLALILARPPERGEPFNKLAIPERGALILQQRFAQQRDDTSPALLYLAVRAARRALADNPNDARAYLVLGESYLALLHDTREGIWAGQLKNLGQLRHAQASAALNQAVFLKPDYARAHLSLGRLYREVGYLDLALNHLRTYFRLLQKVGIPAGISAERFQAETSRFQEELNQLTKQVSTAEDAFVVASSGAPVFDRASHASRNGLAGKARDLLLESHRAAFGPGGMELELELLLGTGRARDVREWMLPEHKEDLEPSAYHWIRLRALAASGDYVGAEEESAELAQVVTSRRADKEPVPFRESMALLIGQTVLDAHSGGGVLPYEVRQPFGRIEYTSRIVALARKTRQKAEVTVLRGLLALELGAVDEAEFLFREVLAIWKDESAAASGGGLDFNGRALAQTCLQWLEDARKKAPPAP